MASGISQMRGQLAHDATTGTYTLDNHGSQTAVSYEVYEHSVAVQNRLFLGGAAMFTSIGVAVALNHWVIRRRYDIC